MNHQADPGQAHDALYMKALAYSVQVPVSLLNARKNQALVDLRASRRAMRFCRWILRTSVSPSRREWAEQELSFYRLRARSSIGIARNPF